MYAGSQVETTSGNCAQGDVRCAGNKADLPGDCDRYVYVRKLRRVANEVVRQGCRKLQSRIGVMNL